MKAKNYEALNNILNEYKLELSNIESRMNENSLKVQEAECYIGSILQEEAEDFKIFSPRKINNLHKTEINKSEQEKINYLRENDKLFFEKEKLLSKIESLECIMEEESNNENENDLIILKVQENDRRRIARDLHDTSLQNISYLIHKIELSSMFIDQDPLRAKLELSVVNKHLRSVIDEIRSIIFDLRPMPFDDLGLAAAFERLVDVLNEDKKFEVDMDIEDVSCENNIVLVTIYRVVQECMTNIVKHAEATKVILKTKVENSRYYICISDNGKGFVETELEEKNNHFGLSLVQERINMLGGNITINSEIGMGTKIEMYIPLEGKM